MRCPSCSFENPAGFRFCGRCGAGLAEGSARPGYTPRHLEDRVLRSRSALEGERKELTVLFADVKGSLRLANQLGPEEWHRVLDRFFRILADGVHRFEGTVNQYTGDGMMALFGAPVAHEDHAQRACHAALHILGELRSLSEALRARHRVEFQVRMGLNSGEVVVGTIGDDLRMDYTAQGQVVGLAARMEQLAEPGRIYLTEQVERLVRGFFRVEPLGSRRVAGAAEPVQVYELAAAGSARTRLELSGSRPALVGRGSALASLAKALDRARRADGLVLGIEGEAGVGKSRLCQEFVARCRGEGVRVVESHCPPYGRALAHFALRELVRSFFEIDEAESDDAAREKLEKGTRGLGSPHAAWLLCALLGRADGLAPSPAPSRAEREEALAALFTKLVVQVAVHEPVVVLVDDLHWIDPASEAVLERLAEQVPGTGALLVVNFRPEHRRGWMKAEGFLELSLAPLGREASLELIGALLGPDASTAGLPELVRQRSGGNPLFIEELLRSLVEAGNLAGGPGRYRLLEAPDALEIPESVRAVIAARIDRLGEAEKRVLQTAAVVGNRFPEQVLARVCDLPEPELGAALRALRIAGLVREEGVAGGHAFHHPLTREVAYRSLLSERRRELHAAVASALIESGERLGERATLIAMHWDEAGRARYAGQWRRRAALRVTNIVPRGTR